MGVTDWGEINQPLGAPALGGAGGWADSVAQALNNKDETVDARLAALEAALEAQIGDLFKIGYKAYEGNADGTNTVTHGLGRSPVAVICTGYTSNDTAPLRSVHVYEVSSTIFRARCFADLAANPTGSFYWVVL